MQRCTGWGRRWWTQLRCWPRPRQQQGAAENHLAAIASFGLDEYTFQKILTDLECDGIEWDELQDYKLISLVGALDVDDFGPRADWVAAYIQFNGAGDPNTPVPARWNRKEIILRMAAKSLGF